MKMSHSLVGALWVAGIVGLAGCASLQSSEELETAESESATATRGAPVPAGEMDAVEAFDPETETLLADLREGIRFEGSTGTLSLNSKARLNKLVEKTQNYGLGPIEIVVPADRLEQKAARAKAMAVQNYLESQGIDPLDIDVYTEGSPELSAAANDSAVQISIRPY